MNENDQKLPPTGPEVTQPMKAIPEIPQLPPEMPPVEGIVAPDTIKYKPDGTPIDTLLTTAEGLEDIMKQGKTPTEEEILRVARMENARDKK